MKEEDRGFGCVVLEPLGTQRFQRRPCCVDRPKWTFQRKTPKQQGLKGRFKVKGGHQNNSHFVPNFVPKFQLKSYILLHFLSQNDPKWSILEISRDQWDISKSVILDQSLFLDFPRFFSQFDCEISHEISHFGQNLFQNCPLAIVWSKVAPGCRSWGEDWPKIGEVMPTWRQDGLSWGQVAGQMCQLRAKLALTWVTFDPRMANLSDFGWFFAWFCTTQSYL